LASMVDDTKQYFRLLELDDGNHLLVGAA
uniref:ABC transporter ATP-binding protein n=1 Tax=Globodera pallida TaxID=36090 RepID=A0A183CK80_GLOPA